MPILGVNIDHVATLRQARGDVRYPDPVSAATIATNAGADQITVHLREDRRHIQDADLWTLRKIVQTQLNLEMAASDEIVDIAMRVKPDIATFVPERRQELTTEGGLDVADSLYKLTGYVRKLKDNSIVVSMFIDPELEQVKASKEAGAQAVEFHTGKYCALLAASVVPTGRKGKLHEPDLKVRTTETGFTCSATTIVTEIERIKKAAILAKELGLHVAAGHGLNYNNASLIVKEVPEIVEYNIGHSIIARAVFVGLAQAVKEMKALVG